MGSKIMLNWVLSPTCRVWYLEDYWEELMSLLKEITFTLRHIYREGNARTNLLARLGP